MSPVFQAGEEGALPSWSTYKLKWLSGRVRFPFASLNLISISLIGKTLDL